MANASEAFAITYSCLDLPPPLRPGEFEQGGNNQHKLEGAKDNIAMAANCEKVVNDLFAAWTRLDLDGIMSYFDENGVWTYGSMNNPAKGKAAVREHTRGFLKDMEAFDAKILKSWHIGNIVFHERVDSVRMKNGKTASIPVAGVFEVDDAGKITCWRDYFDLTTFTKQIS
jgi:limonene-1,2-epoxide hydrolase